MKEKSSRGGASRPGIEIVDRRQLIDMTFDAVQVPLVILDEHLHILSANSIFNEKFGATNKRLDGELFYEIGNGQWNNASLRKLLEKVVSNGKNLGQYEMEKDITDLGRRILHIRAHGLPHKDEKKFVLVSITDVTEQRVRGEEREKLIAQKALHIREMRHRIANSLQLIANTLLIKAEEVESAESREHLIDAHERITAIAEIQKQLNFDRVASGEEIELKDYLGHLGKWLARSMVGRQKDVTISVEGSSGNVPSATAISIGLVATELVINALKHAFPGNKAGHVVISHEKTLHGWSLNVRDDGISKSGKSQRNNTPGMGMGIIGALAKQLHAVIRTERSDHGTSVTLFHANA